MKIRVEDGHGRAVGMLETPDKDVQRGFYLVEWTQKVCHTRNTYSNVRKRMWVTLSECIPYGHVIGLKWRGRERLKRAGLLLPYEEIIRD